MYYIELDPRQARIVKDALKKRRCKWAELMVQEDDDDIKELCTEMIEEIETIISIIREAQ